MRVKARLLLVWLSSVLVACASTDTALRESTEPELVSWEEGCQAPTTLDLFCAQGTCALFRCRDMEPAVEDTSGKVEPARWIRPPQPTGGRRRGARYPRPDADPVFLIRWNNHPPPPAPTPRPARTAPEWVKHHIFPQEAQLAAWFQLQGFNIHQFTLLIPRDVHIRIHSGGPRGGMWNAEWRQFIRGRERVPPEQIWEHAFKLIIDYKLAGASMVPYR
jgi:uncharacterized lipoprotein (TIGR02269 family)